MRFAHFLGSLQRTLESPDRSEEPLRSRKGAEKVDMRNKQRDRKMFRKKWKVGTYEHKVNTTLATRCVQSAVTCPFLVYRIWLFRWEVCL